MRVLKLLVGLLLILIAVAAVVAWTLPAQLAWRMAASRLPSLQLEGVQGSVWNGHAAQASVAGQPLGALVWQVEPWPLLRGDMRAKAQLSDGGFPASGTLTRHRDGSIDVHDAHIELPAEVLHAALGIEQVDLLGSLQINVHAARVRHAWFEALDADARWHDAGVSGIAQARFGDVLAKISMPEPPRVHGEIRDAEDGTLFIRGDFDALPTGYTLKARLAARNANDLQTQEALQFLGERQPDGSVLMQAGGQLLVPGLP